MMLEKNKYTYIKLFAILLFFAYIVINNNFKIENKIEAYFIFVKIIYLITILLTTIYVSFFVNKYNFEKLSGKLIFIITLLYYIRWIPYGIDITDHGYNLSKAWFIFDKSSFQSSDIYTLGSYFITGIWLHLIGIRNVLWANFGYALTLSTMALLSYKIITLYIKDKRNIIFWAVIASSLLPVTRSAFTLDYNIIPVLLILLSTYLLLLGLKVNNAKYLSLSGIFIILAIFSRVPYFLYVFFPFLLIFYKTKIKRKRVFFLRHLLSGYLVGSIIVIFLLALSSSLTDYFHFFKTITGTDTSITNNNAQNFEYLYDETHNYMFLLNLYLKDFFQIIKLTLIYLVVFISFSVLQFKNYYKYIVSVAIVILLYLYNNSLKNTWTPSIIAIGLSLLLIVIFFHKNKKDRKELAIISVIIAGYSFLGSNNGVRNILLSGGVIIFLGSSIALINSVSIKIKNISLNFKLISLGILISISLFAIQKRYNYVYRDAPRSKLTTMFQTPSLWGMYSTSERVKVLTEIINAVDSLNIKDNEFILVNKNHFIPYLCNIKPKWQVWVNIPEILKNSIANNNEPKYIIAAIKNTSIANWPNTKSLAPSNFIAQIQGTIQFAEIYYKIIYTNKMFSIYEYIGKQEKNSLSRGLVAYYPLNGNATDFSGNNFHGKLIGTNSVPDKNNHKNSALYFDGKSYIQIKNDSLLNPHKEITLCAWYKPENFAGSGSDPIISKGYIEHKPPYYQYHLSVTGTLYKTNSGGSYNFAISTNKLNAISTSPNFFKNNKWYFLTAVYNNQRMLLYIDGRIVQGRALSGNISKYNTDVFIGKAGNFKGFIKGTLDEVRIYNRALNIEEVEMLFSNKN